MGNGFVTAYIIPHILQTRAPVGRRTTQGQLSGARVLASLSSALLELQPSTVDYQPATNDDFPSGVLTIH